MLSVVYSSLLSTMPGYVERGVTYNQLNDWTPAVLPQQQAVANELAAACNAWRPVAEDTPFRCNAFSTSGQLMITAFPATFNRLDITSTVDIDDKGAVGGKKQTVPAIDYCDGVYVASDVNPTGVDISDLDGQGNGETIDNLRTKGAASEAKAAKLKAAVDRVSASMGERSRQFFLSLQGRGSSLWVHVRLSQLDIDLLTAFPFVWLCSSRRT